MDPAKSAPEQGQGPMADLIGTMVLGIQYSLIVFIVNLWLRTTLPFGAVTVGFLILGSIGMVLWHRKKFSQPVKKWGSLAAGSVGLGIAFFGADFLLALLRGQVNPLHFPGGLLGLPLTFLVCPGGTIICLAGLARALYIGRGTAGTE
jgi:hypothetical protein